MHKGPRRGESRREECAYVMSALHCPSALACHGGYSACLSTSCCPWPLTGTGLCKGSAQQMFKGREGASQGLEDPRVGNGRREIGHPQVRGL